LNNRLRFCDLKYIVRLGFPSNWHWHH